MGYSWGGMHKLTWNEVKEMHKKGELDGCYKLYDDDTESEIGSGYDFIDDILEHHENGGEFGMEIDTVELNMLGGKKILSPVYINLFDLSDFDELEYETWNLIERYLAMLGIRTFDDSPDWESVKIVQNKIMEVLKTAGVDFEICRKDD